MPNAGSRTRPMVKRYRAEGDTDSGRGTAARSAGSDPGARGAGGMAGPQSSPPPEFRWDCSGGCWPRRRTEPALGRPGAGAAAAISKRGCRGTWCLPGCSCWPAASPGCWRQREADRRLRHPDVVLAVARRGGWRAHRLAAGVLCGRWWGPAEDSSTERQRRLLAPLLRRPGSLAGRRRAVSVPGSCQPRGKPRSGSRPLGAGNPASVTADQRAEAAPGARKMDRVTLTPDSPAQTTATPPPSASAPSTCAASGCPLPGSAPPCRGAQARAPWPMPKKRSSDIIAAVRSRGFDALRELALRFDGVEQEHPRVPAEALQAALAGPGPGGAGRPGGIHPARAQVRRRPAPGRHRRRTRRRRRRQPELGPGGPRWGSTSPAAWPSTRPR